MGLVDFKTISPALTADLTWVLNGE